MYTCFYVVFIWQDESSLIHTDNTKKPVFSAEQVAILEELRDSGMVSTAHVCQPQIQQAVLATGLTQKQVKVNNCVQLIPCNLRCYATVPPCLRISFRRLFCIPLVLAQVCGLYICSRVHMESWMQHLVGVCLRCHCCSSPLGSRFPSRCCTASRWCQFRCVACLFVTHADMQINAASCRFMPALLLLQFPPWQQVPLKMLQCIPLVPVQCVACTFIRHMY